MAQAGDYNVLRLFYYTYKLLSVTGYVITGLVIVGVTDALYQNPGESKGRNSLITGDLLIIVAQVISACQMVYEEKYVSGIFTYYFF